MAIKKTGFALALTMMLPLAACDVDQTEQGELPDVEVEGEADMPEYDVETPDVDVSTDTIQIQTPSVDVDPPAGGEGGEDGARY